MAALQEEQLPRGCAVVKGKIVDVQQSSVSMYEQRDRSEQAYSLQCPFQFVIIEDEAGTSHILINPGTRAVLKAFARVVYYTHSPGIRGVSFHNIATASIEADNVGHDHNYRRTVALPEGRVPAEGIIKDLEYAIKVGSPGGK